MEDYEGCNILLLGVSFVDNITAYSDVKQQVEKGKISQIDGRDLARCLKMESLLGVNVYTVSLESAAVYREDRHFSGNFNHRNFVKEIKRRFNGCQFDQIILDYFWMPQGCWERHHWKTAFFKITLPLFVRESILVERKTERIGFGVIFLPFSFYCFKEIVSASQVLRQFFSISFLRKGELYDNLLWYSTQFLDAHDMMNTFGKHINQEEEYCTFDVGRMNQMLAAEDSVSITELRKVAYSLEHFNDIRFIMLQRSKM